MNKLLLRLVMLPSGMWRGMGADVVQLQAILGTKLKMDDRKPPSIGMQRAQKQKKDRKHSSVFGMFLSAMFGLIYMFPIVGIDDRVFSLTIYFSLFTFLLTLTLITDFSNVLFDTRDKFIILPRPVNDQTIVLSRMLHVFIYLFRIVLPMSLPGWIALGIIDGWKSALIFPFVLLLTTFMVLFFVNIFYLLILKLAKPERFKEVINYFQIITSIVFFASAYLLPRAIDRSAMTHTSINDYQLIRFSPTYWLAACWSWLKYPALPYSRLLSGLAVIFPLVCLFILVKWLAPQFGRNIGAIDVSEGAETSKTISKTNGGKLYKWLANMLNREEDTKAGFIIAWLQTGRSRTFKMRVYPLFAYIPIYLVYIMTLDKQRSIKETFQNLHNNAGFLFILYMSSFVILQAMQYLVISDQYKASWIYSATPIDKPGHIMFGAFKVMWLKYFLPFFILISIFVLSIWGINKLPDIILALVNATLFSMCVARINFRYLPFSKMEQMSQKGLRILKTFLGMIVPVALAGGHYLALNLWWLKLLFIILSSILLWLVADSYKNTTWENMKKLSYE